MSGSVGVVLLTESGERGAFVLPVEIEAFRELITVMLRTQTVAGPPLIPGPLEDLAAKLAVPLTTGSRAPVEIRLTAVDVECLTLLHHQIALRQRLPLRIRRTCTTCGTTKIVNPNLVKKSNNGELFGTTADAAIDTIGMLADGHYVRAVIKVMGTAGIIADKTKEEGPVCEVCEGQDFATPAVTYCPNCKNLRDETILLECPDCGIDFVEPEDRLTPWRAADRAFADLRRTTSAAIIEEYASKFEKGLYAGQKKALAEAVTGEDELLFMCRCGRLGEALRAVALLLTTRQLVWARQLVAGDVTSGAIPWSTVTKISRGPSVKDHGPAFEIETSDGVRLALNGFKGSGVSFDHRTYIYSADAIANLIAGFASVAVTGMLAPAPPPAQYPQYPQPAQYQPPAQYPQPTVSPAPAPAPMPVPPAYPAAAQVDPPVSAPPEPHVAIDEPAPTIRAVARVYPAAQAQPDQPRVPAPGQSAHHVPDRPAYSLPAQVAYPPPAQPVYPPLASVADLSTAPPPLPPAGPGWYEDPLSTYRYRWWDGSRWTATFHR